MKCKPQGPLRGIPSDSVRERGKTGTVPAASDYIEINDLARAVAFTKRAFFECV